MTMLASVLREVYARLQILESAPHLRPPVSVHVTEPSVTMFNNTSALLTTISFVIPGQNQESNIHSTQFHKKK
jgi:hypothetical protein